MEECQCPNGNPSCLWEKHEHYKETPSGKWYCPDVPDALAAFDFDQPDGQEQFHPQIQQEGVSSQEKKREPKSPAQNRRQKNPQMKKNEQKKRRVPTEKNRVWQNNRRNRLRMEKCENEFGYYLMCPKPDCNTFYSWFWLKYHYQNVLLQLPPPSVPFPPKELQYSLSSGSHSHMYFNSSPTPQGVKLWLGVPLSLILGTRSLTWEVKEPASTRTLKLVIGG
ncbi:hypothetical protein T439DRAFT_337373 [Meredithblackwellia eburnea MCA 4105]